TWRGDWQPGQVQPLTINAVNVVDGTQAWIFATGPDSALVRMQDLSIAQTWTWSNHVDSRGPFGFGIAVDDQHFLVSGWSGPELALWDLKAGRKRDLTAVDDNG